MVICLQRGADLHMAQLMPLPLTISCYSKIQIGFTCLVPAHLGSPGQRAVKRVCVIGDMAKASQSTAYCFTALKITNDHFPAEKNYRYIKRLIDAARRAPHIMWQRRKVYVMIGYTSIGLCPVDSSHLSIHICHPRSSKWAA